MDTFRVLSVGRIVVVGPSIYKRFSVGEIGPKYLTVSKSAYEAGYSQCCINGTIRPLWPPSNPLILLGFRDGLGLAP